MKNHQIKFSKISVLLMFWFISYFCKKQDPIPLQISFGSNGYLTENKIEYKPENLMDKYISPYCVKPGNEKPQFTITYNQEVKLGLLHIMNGYAKGDLFEKNSRVAKLNIKSDDGNSVEIVIPDEKESFVNFGKTLTGKEFKFFIEDVHKGSKYEDICISEIGFDKNEFSGSINFNAYCNFLNETFKQIEIIGVGSSIYLYPNGSVGGHGSPAQVDIENEISGKWKLYKDERGLLSIDVNYVLRKVQAANDDLTVTSSETVEHKSENSFSLDLSTNAKCTTLADSTFEIVEEGNRNSSAEIQLTK
ncbi:hypothetical protein CH352_02180 [Leptospira hartskeerlii]|uniref:NAD glycohydrolase translocation F5/8 type C domain-containing protein n=1 Tax=Leptospira hartskeerlii TaxID=2023177 RepID=A0A2M9XDL9_9LEPT|nr:hypothetical protein [Leptospira hartskeerlii]PJZ25734.1 hypothetical protein CH357_08795 [Leptospira hartskeerlii]PJZ35443.1 hypothetical protein CH352_02180 [Leptospira hartskeerlii]